MASNLFVNGYNWSPTMENLKYCFHSPNCISLEPLVCVTLPSLVFSPSHPPSCFSPPDFCQPTPSLISYLPFHSLPLVRTQMITFPSFSMWSLPLSRILVNWSIMGILFETCTWRQMAFDNGFPQGTNNVWGSFRVLAITPSVIPNPFSVNGLGLT